MIKLIYTNYIGKKVKYKTVSLISFMREYRKLLQVIDNRTFLTPQDQENDFFSCGSSLHFKMLILEYESCGYGELFLKSKEGLHLFLAY